MTSSFAKKLVSLCMDMKNHPVDIILCCLLPSMRVNFLKIDKTLVYEFINFILLIK